MTPGERRAYDAGLRAALRMARITALTIKTSPGATNVRKQAAVGALYAFAEAAVALALNSKPEADRETL